MFKKLIFITVLALINSFNPDSGLKVNKLQNKNNRVPSIKKRMLMNNILLWGGVYPTLIGLGVPYILFFIPPSKQSTSSQFALDKYGNIINNQEFIASKGDNTRNLVQGLNGDPTYLLVEDNTIKNFGLNAICTHLGCVVPWNYAENKFMCPCHGSQYDTNGKVIIGPAPLPLQLQKVTIENNQVSLSKWNEEIDFRTNDKPWWI